MESTARAIAEKLFETHNAHLLSLEEVAAELSISSKTIRNQMVLGSFPIRITRLGRLVRVSIHDLATFLAGEPVEPAAPAKRGRGRPRKVEQVAQIARRAAGGAA